jgi:hypothetical protein
LDFGLEAGELREYLALSQGRGWPAAGAFTSRGGPGEGSLGWYLNPEFKADELFSVQSKIENPK